eukprot:TRINITY_DN21054_c0_g1_i1.p1 TRINITY_DN21054_c0_g1~~TRINITY_DN21054_c0_g1_i1.p1  ORF type:complete len:486 (-),score=48.61 TRINITY_DN21054_c0_g1_i1:90-1547(-)
MAELNDLICCWRDLFYGQACCFWNCVFCPCVTCFWANTIFCLGCINVYINRSFYKFCCCLCRTLNCCWLYTDKEFPPDSSSLGDIGGDTASTAGGKSDANVIWLRANEFPGAEKMQLFGGTIDARDIRQGQLGDCWLLAAMACVAEHKGAINAVFRSKERNPRGKYTMRLYDGSKEKWVFVTVDDYIPCDKDSWERHGIASPLFTKPNGNELWAMLLEKAFAKLCGGFANIEGGQTIWGIRAMTGDLARQYGQQEDGKGWKGYDFNNLDDPKNKRAHSLRSRAEILDDDMMFEVLFKYNKLKSVLSASSSSGEQGLVKGHAYSILDVRRVNSGMLGVGGKNFRMVKIRNPWGRSEWQGDWSDRSKLWQEYSRVKDALGHEDVNDGSFWMCWEDYCKHWKQVGVVHRSIDINTVRLSVKDDTCLAPCKGCLLGCLRYWFCCQGIQRLYCPHHSSDETIEVGTGWFGCLRRRKRSGSGYSTLERETE